MLKLRRQNVRDVAVAMAVVILEDVLDVQTH